MASTFALALEDYYGAVAIATSGGTCSLNSPSNDILLSEAGRFAPIQSGVSTFTQFEVTGDPLNCTAAFFSDDHLLSEWLQTVYLYRRH